LFDFPTLENCAISKIIFEKELFSLDKTNDLESTEISSDNTTQILSCLVGSHLIEKFFYL